MLSRHERVTWASLEGSDHHRSQWLHESAAAKDAVHEFLSVTFGLELYPADIEILTDEHGRLLAAGSWAQRVDHVPVVASASCDGVAIAIAGDGARYRGIGLGLERIDRVDDPVDRLDGKERELVAALDGPLRHEWALRLWCAKDAAAKALGLGPTASLVAAALDVERGRAGVSAIAERGAVPLTVHTTCDGGRIAALAVVER